MQGFEAFLNGKFLSYQKRIWEEQENVEKLLSDAYRDWFIQFINKGIVHTGISQEIYKEVLFSVFKCNDVLTLM